MRTLIIGVFAWGTCFLASGQNRSNLPDYVVSWKGDTIRCRLVNSDDAKDMPLARRQRFWTQVLFAWDSSGRLRTYRPGDLKAFFRKQKVSRRYNWPSGLHESFVIPILARSWSSIAEDYPVGKDSAWAYLRQVVRGNYLGLYTFSEWQGEDHVFEYYATVTGDSLRGAHVFNRKSELAPYLADAPKTAALLPNLEWRRRKRHPHLIALFIHYNYERANLLHQLPERYRKILGI